MSGLRRLPPIVPDLIRPAAPGEAPSVVAGAPTMAPTDAAGGRAFVAGPLCTPLDSWARNALLPDVRPGDLLAVPNVGAYGLYASLIAFLGHPAPVEIVVRDGRIAEISRLQLSRGPVSHPTKE
jgi:diaminopimelate decarboxylase